MPRRPNFPIVLSEAQKAAVEHAAARAHLDKGEFARRALRDACAGVGVRFPDDLPKRGGYARPKPLLIRAHRMLDGSLRVERVGKPPRGAWLRRDHPLMNVRLYLTGAWHPDAWIDQQQNVEEAAALLALEETGVG